mgnify:CR=1 FL=1|jgi:hypothetical protein
MRSICFTLLIVGLGSLIAQTTVCILSEQLGAHSMIL